MQNFDTWNELCVRTFESINEETNGEQSQKNEKEKKSHKHESLSDGFSFSCISLV